MSIKELLNKIEKLPVSKRKEVENYVMQLIEHVSPKTKKSFKFKWEGGLEDLKSKYTSVELQHKLWGDDLKSI